jgi:hypothetical protein
LFWQPVSTVQIATELQHRMLATDMRGEVRRIQTRHDWFPWRITGYLLSLSADLDPPPCRDLQRRLIPALPWVASGFATLSTDDHDRWMTPRLAAV